MLGLALFILSCSPDRSLKPDQCPLFCRAGPNAVDRQLRDLPHVGAGDGQRHRCDVQLGLQPYRVLLLPHHAGEHH